MKLLPEMFLKGSEITISNWCLDPLQLMTDKVLLILTWDNVLIETVGAWLYPSALWVVNRYYVVS